MVADLTEADRVFAHALQTVRKIPKTGSARPPAEDRLRLYGLYKQSMGACSSARVSVCAELIETPGGSRGRCERRHGSTRVLRRGVESGERKMVTNSEICGGRG